MTLSSVSDTFWVFQQKAQGRRVPFYLVKLCQMRHVYRLVAEDAVDGEVAGRPRVLCQSMQHPRRDRRGVRPQHQTQRLVFGPGIAVSHRTESAVLVHVLDVLEVRFVVARLALPLALVRVQRLGAGFHGVHLRVYVGVCARLVGLDGVGDEEGVLHVSGGVLLGDEEGVEVPEARVYVAVRRLGERVGEDHARRCAYWPVGISTKPCERKMSRYACRTLFNGCRAPAFCDAPSALKL